MRKTLTRERIEDGEWVSCLLTYRRAAFVSKAIKWEKSKVRILHWIDTLLVEDEDMRMPDEGEVKLLIWART